MRSKYLYLLVAMVVCLALVVSGCGMIAEKATEKATEKAIENATGGQAKVDLSNKDGSVEIKGNDGSSMKMGGTNEWPKTVPSDVPKFDGGKISSVIESNNEKSKGVMVGFDEVSVASFDKIKSSLEGSGWKISMTSKSDDGYMIIASKEKRQYTVNVSEKTKGLITYSEEVAKP
ncbi:MAG: hypothetical protein HPY50_00105 [Firmicutes bacterium]|nr:hypothetical protein [Bacillota bacterium]